MHATLRLALAAFLALPALAAPPTSKVKASLRGGKARTQETLTTAVATAITEISPDDAKRYC